MTTAKKFQLCLCWIIFFVSITSCSGGMQPIAPTETITEWSNRPPPHVPDTLPEMIEALSSPNQEIQVVAARMLVAYGPKAIMAVPALSRNLQSQNYEVRRATLRAIRAIGSGAKPLVPNLIVVLLTDTEVHVRRDAAEALGSIGDVSSIPALAHCLGDPDSGTAIYCAISTEQSQIKIFPICIALVINSMMMAFQL